MEKPDIAVVYVESIESSVFEDVRQMLVADGLRLRVESRPDPGPFAGVEWLIPTVVFAYIGKSYFDSFLKEAGKDHYNLLKRGLKKLAGKFFGENAPKGYLVF